MIAGGALILRAAIGRYLPVFVAAAMLAVAGMAFSSTLHELHDSQRELDWVRARLVEKRALVKRHQNEIALLAGAVDRVTKQAQGAREQTVQLRRVAHLEESREPESSPLEPEVIPDTGQPLYSELGSLALQQLAWLDGQTASMNESVVLLSTLVKSSKTSRGSIPSRWPVRGNVTSEFGVRSAPWGGGSDFHPGVDIKASMGTPVTTTGAGEVVFAGMMSGYGAMVVVDHGNDLKTVYAHLSRIYTEVGRFVRQGEVVGAVGNTGRATGVHLHYEVRVGGQPVDPGCWLQTIAVPARVLTLTAGG
jgi:murein DD-endopeptidase MepM/ murein hydrolase activator NlpD